MSRGLAYDSDDGRAFAGAVTAIMTGEAYRQSAVIARDHGGAFNDYAINEGPFLRVIGKHRDAAHELDEAAAPDTLVSEARTVWDEALELGQKHGYRNAQVSVLAPTGTIAFMMDCDTTGIEPDIALIKYKKLVGEGFLKIVNQTVPLALQRLGYTADEVEAIIELHRRVRDHRGRTRPQAGAPVGLRLRLQAGQRRALHRPHGPPAHDERHPALPLGRHQQDREHARERPRPRTSRMSTCRAGSWASRPSPSTATAPSAASRSRRARRRMQRMRLLPRQVRRRGSSSLGSPSHTVAACRTSVERSRTSTRSPATRATSPWASTRTGSLARSS